MRKLFNSICSIVLMIAWLPVTACGPQNANVQPQASIAHYGTDVVNGVSLFQDLIIKASTGPTPIMTTAQAKPYMDKILAFAETAQKLSVALKEYDALTAGVEKQAKAKQVQTILAALGGLGSLANGLPAGIASEAAKLVGNVTDAVASVRSAVAAASL